jgi:hypothetical protein
MPVRALPAAPAGLGARTRACPDRDCPGIDHPRGQRVLCGRTRTVGPPDERKRLRSMHREQMAPQQGSEFRPRLLSDALVPRRLGETVPRRVGQEWPGDVKAVIGEGGVVSAWVGDRVPELAGRRDRPPPGIDLPSHFPEELPPGAEEARHLRRVTLRQAEPKGRPDLLRENRPPPRCVYCAARAAVELTAAQRRAMELQPAAGPIPMGEVEDICGSGAGR